MKKALFCGAGLGALIASAGPAIAASADSKPGAIQTAPGGTAPLLIPPPPAGIAPPTAIAPPGAIPPAPLPPGGLKPVSPAVTAPPPASLQDKLAPGALKPQGTTITPNIPAPTGKAAIPTPIAPGAITAGKDLRQMDDLQRDTNIDSLMGMELAPQLGGTKAGAAPGTPGAQQPELNIQNPGAALGAGSGKVSLQPGESRVDSALGTAPGKASTPGLAGAAAYGTSPGVKSERLNTGELRTTFVSPSGTPGVVNVTANYLSPSGQVRDVVGISFRQGGVVITQGTEISPNNPAMPVQPVTIVTNMATGNSVVIRAVTGDVTQETAVGNQGTAPGGSGGDSDGDDSVPDNPYGDSGDSGGGGNGDGDGGDDDEVLPNPYADGGDTDTSGSSDSGSSDNGDSDSGDSDSGGSDSDSSDSDSGDSDSGGDETEPESDTASGTSPDGCANPGPEEGCGADLLSALPPDLAAFLMSNDEDGQHRKKVKSQLDREQTGQGNPEDNFSGHGSGTGSPFAPPSGRVQVWDMATQPGPLGSAAETIIWGAKPDVGQAINPTPKP
jgi:hypothetical protein